MHGHRARHAMKHLLYRKMLKMQIGSCHSDISEGTILDMMSQLSSVGFEVVMAYPSYLGEFMVKNCVVGYYLYSKFGSSFIVPSLFVFAGLYGVNKLSDIV